MEDQSTIHKTGIGYFQNQRTVMLKYIPKDATRILEVGCGEGEFCRTLNRTDREIWGVEMNSEAAEKAAKTRRFGLPIRVTNRRQPQRQHRRCSRVCSCTNLLQQNHSYFCKSISHSVRRGHLLGSFYRRQWSRNTDGQFGAHHGG